MTQPQDTSMQRGGPWVWQLVAVGAMALLMLVLRSTHPWVYLANDKRNQYLPVLQDIGRRLREGDFPAVDPDLGPSGNYALDVQYGLFDPMHWGIGYLLSRVDDAYLAGWLMSLAFLLVLVWGTTALVQRLGCHGVWSAVAGLGAGTAGYLFFNLAPYWWPGVVGAAFLPWLWHAWLAPRGVLRLLRLALLAFLVVASGWPSAWLAASLLGAGLLAETVVRRRQQLRREGWVDLVAGGTAVAAGVLAGAVSIIPLLRASTWTSREQGISNTYYNIVNWADVASFAIPYLRGDLSSHNSKPTLDDPIFFFGWFLLALMWLTVWHRGVWQRPGVVTAAVATAGALLATQLPSDLGPIRIPSRQLGAVQFFAVVLVVLAWRGSPAHLTVRRVAGVFASFGAMAVVAWSRTPTDWEVYAGIGAALAGLTVLLVLWRLRGVVAAGVWALMATVALPVLAMSLENPDAPERVELVHTELSVQRDERPAFVVFPDRSARPEWLAEGVGIGFSALDETNRFAPGYSSVSQRHFRARFRIGTPSGKSEPEAAIKALFALEPTSGAAWVDLLGYQTLLVPEQRAGLVDRLADGGWLPTTTSESFVKYSRAPANALPHPGRVTAVPEGDVEVVAGSTEGELQDYEVVAPDGGRLVLRDLYWPGYVATLDGAPVPVTPFKKTLISIALPPEAEGELVVRFRAQTPLTLAATLGGGGALLAGAIALHLLTERRRRGQ